VWAKQGSQMRLDGVFTEKRFRKSFLDKLAQRAGSQAAATGTIDQGNLGRSFELAHEILKGLEQVAGCAHLFHGIRRPSSKVKMGKIPIISPTNAWA
jgi:hypothetical protein